MNKKNSQLLLVLTCVSALCLGAGFMMGSAFTIHEAIRGLEYIDNVNIEVDINETLMVEAMMPYIEANENNSRQNAGELSESEVY